MGVDGNLKHDVSDIGCGVVMYDRTEEKLLDGTYEEPDDESSDECDDAEEEEEGVSDEDEINEEHASGESDESEEESDNEGEEDNLDEDNEEEASSEEENLDEGSEEEESDDDDKSEETSSKDVIVSTNVVTTVQPSKQNSKQNRHIVFDEEDNFENFPLTDSLVGSSKVNDERPEDSDSDAAPEEATLAMGKKLADGEDMKVKKELRRTKQKAKEDRKRKHEKNKLQQEQKRQRIENLSRKRLPKELLKAVVAEREMRPKQKIAIQKSEGKVKTFTDDSVTDSSLVGENVDEEGLITLKQGVHVRALKQEIKKNLSIANRAAEFRQKAFYGMRVKRMSSKELQQMKVRQEKGGKNFLVTR